MIGRVLDKRRFAWQAAHEASSDRDVRGVARAVRASGGMCVPTYVPRRPESGLLHELFREHLEAPTPRMSPLGLSCAPMRIGLAHLDPTVGDLATKARKIVDAARAFADARAALVAAPELALTGYPSKDLLLALGFVDGARRALDALERPLPVPTLVAPVRILTGSRGILACTRAQGPGAPMPSPPRISPRYQAALDRSPRRRCGAIFSLALAAVAIAARAQPADERAAQVQDLERRGAPIELVAPFLNDPAAAVRAAAVTALGRAGDARATEALARFLGEPDPAARLAAIHALGQLGAAASLPGLYAALRSSDAHDRATAAAGIALVCRVDRALDDPARAAAQAELAPLLDDPAAVVREAAALAVGATRAAAGVAALAQRLERADPALRWRLVHAVGRAGGESAVEVLAREVERLSREPAPPWCHALAARGLAEASAASAAGPLTRLVRHPDPLVSAPAARGLAAHYRSGAPEVGAALLGALATHPAWATRAEAARALGAASGAVRPANASPSRTSDQTQDLFIPTNTIPKGGIKRTVVSSWNPDVDFEVTIFPPGSKARDKHDVVLPAEAAAGTPGQGFDTTVPCKICGSPVKIRIRRLQPPAEGSLDRPADGSLYSLAVPWSALVRARTTDRSAAVRAAALEALVTLEPERAGELLETATARTERDAIARALGAALARTDAPTARSEAWFAHARALLAGDEPALSIALATGIAPSVTGEAYDLLASMLGAQDPDLRAVAAAALVSAAVQPPAEMAGAFAQALASAAGDEMAPARAALARLLGRTGAPAAIAPCQAALRDPRREVRAAAADALVAISGERLRPADGPIPAAPAFPGSDLPIAARPVVILETTKGDLELTLAPLAAPLRVRALLLLVDRGYYAGRAIDLVVAGRYVQGGAPRAGGFGDAASAIGLGHLALPNEPSSLPVEAGTVAMPPAGADAGGGALLFGLAPDPELVGRCTVIGRVTRGLGTLDRLELGDRFLAARRVR